MSTNTPDPPMLSSFSPSLLPMYKTLSGGEQKLFRRLFFALWRYLWRIKHFDAVGFSHALPMALDGIITIYEFFLLSRLFLLSGGGVHALDSRTFTMTSSERHRVPVLIKNKLLFRTYFDPASPRLTASRTIQHVYISFTPVGIGYYNKVVKRVNRYVMDDVMSLNTIEHKKGQT